MLIHKISIILIPLEKEGMENNFLMKIKVLQVNPLTLFNKFHLLFRMAMHQINLIQINHFNSLWTSVRKRMIGWTTIMPAILKGITANQSKTTMKVQVFRDKLKRYLKNNRIIQIISKKTQIIPLLSLSQRITVILQIPENIKVALLFTRMDCLAQKVDL